MAAASCVWLTPVLAQQAGGAPIPSQWASAQAGDAGWAATFPGGQPLCNHQADVVSGKGLVAPVTQGSNPDSAVKGPLSLGKAPVLPANPGAGLQGSKAPVECLESMRISKGERWQTANVCLLPKVCA